MLILWNLLRHAFDEESYPQPTKIVHKILLEAVFYLPVLLLTSLSGNYILLIVRKALQFLTVTWICHFLLDP